MGFECLVYYRNNGWLMKHGQGTHNTKMVADKLAENTPNAPKFTCPNCQPKPKNLGFCT